MKYIVTYLVTVILIWVLVVWISVTFSNKEEILKRGKLLKCWTENYSANNHVNFFLLKEGEYEVLYEQYFIDLHEVKRTRPGYPTN